jgi:hypothetical protein
VAELALVKQRIMRVYRSPSVRCPRGTPTSTIQPTRTLGIAASS